MSQSEKTCQANPDTMENKKTSDAASFADNTIPAGSSSSSKKIAKNMKTPGASSKMATKKTPMKMKTLQDSVSSIRSDKTDFTRQNQDIRHNNALSR